jgi:hypothetical protein
MMFQIVSRTGYNSDSTLLGGGVDDVAPQADGRSSLGRGGRRDGLRNAFADVSMIEVGATAFILRQARDEGLGPTITEGPVLSESKGEARPTKH